MPQRFPRAPIRPQPGRREVTDRINRAFETSDIDETRYAIGAAIRLYNISDIAKASGLERASMLLLLAGWIDARGFFDMDHGLPLTLLGEAVGHADANGAAAASVLAPAASDRSYGPAQCLTPVGPLDVSGPRALSAI